MTTGSVTISGRRMMVETRRKCQRGLLVPVCLATIVSLLTGCSSGPLTPTIQPRTLSHSPPPQADASRPSEGDTGPSQREIPPGALGRIAIPSLDIDVPLVEVSWHLEQMGSQTVGVWDTVRGAAGHHRGTALPGDWGNCVISGHSRTSDGAVFDRLWELTAGDRILVTTDSGSQWQYLVESVTKVPEVGKSLDQRQANSSVMAPSAEARLTLITCWPEWAYTHRIVVVARLS